MTIQSLAYEPPIRRPSRRHDLDYELLEKAEELAGEGRPLESLLKVFEHLLPGQKLPDLTKEAFTFTQGSSRVSSRVDGDDLVISVPLVRLPTDGRAIAAMRYVLTKLSATGQLYQPRLHGDDVRLEFRDRLARLHPAKALEVLRRMPSTADDNDDFLIGQFGAVAVDRAPIADLDASELARADAVWRQHWTDVEELVKECQRKRSTFFLNETTAYALYRVGFVLPLSGFVASRLYEAASTFNDCHEDPFKRETALAKCAKDMKAVPAAELAKSLGHATFAIDPHDDGTPSVLGSYLGPGNYIDTIERLKDQGKPFDAALALLSTYNFLLARYSWDEPIERELEAGLAQASGKPWRDAANLLFEHTQGLVEKFAEDEEEGDEAGDENGDEGDDA
jgi:hypothetical protein